MTQSPNLNLPLMASNQAQKHITHNEARVLLDALVMLSIEARTLCAPPSTPSKGERHIVAATAADEWTSHEDKLASWQSGQWVFYTQQEGWLSCCKAEDLLLVYKGT